MSTRLRGMSKGQQNRQTKKARNDAAAPDPLLVELVKLLARVAAERDYIRLCRKIPTERQPSGRANRRDLRHDDRRHLRPLFLRPATRRLDRGSNSPLQGAREARRLARRQLLHRSCDLRRQPDPARHADALAGCAGRKVRCDRRRSHRPAVARSRRYRPYLQARTVCRRADRHALRRRGERAAYRPERARWARCS